MEPVRETTILTQADSPAGQNCFQENQKWFCTKSIPGEQLTIQDRAPSWRVCCLLVVLSSFWFVFQSISITSMQDRGWWLMRWVQRTRFLQQFPKSKIRAETLQTFLKIKCTKGWTSLLPVDMQRMAWIMIFQCNFFCVWPPCFPKLVLVFYFFLQYLQCL